MERLSFKLFNFKGTPVKLNLLFLIGFFLCSPTTLASIFIGVLLHELAHAYMAKIKGYTVDSVDINLLAGSTVIKPQMKDIDSIAVVGAGPLSNLMLSSISFLLFASIKQDFLFTFGFVNLILFAFNILPIIPMDGGTIMKNIFNLTLGVEKGEKIAYNISLVCAIALFVLSIIYGEYIISFFSVLFILVAIAKLEYYKIFMKK